MISINRIVDALPNLTSDAVKLAVLLVVEPTDRADAAWSRKVADKLGLAPHVVQKIVKELADEGLVQLTGRIHLAPMSAGGHSLARISSPSSLDLGLDEPGEIENRDAPWIRRAERSEARSAPGSPEVIDTGSDAREADGARVLAEPDPAPKTLSPLVFVREEFVRMFAEVNQGVKPTWDGRATNLLKQLLATHSADEIVRRMQIMFYEPRRFPAPPYDLSTLRFHFDKFAVSKAAGGMVGDRSRTGASYYGEVTDDV
jgi:hypothetical protein